MGARIGLHVAADPTIDLASDAVVFEEGGGGTGDYNDLTNKPSIEGHVLVGNQTLEQLGITAQALDITAESLGILPEDIGLKTATVEAVDSLFE